MREAAINIKINTRSGQQSINQLNKTVDQTEKRTRRLTEELGYMRDELARMDKGTQEFQEMEQAVVDLTYATDEVTKRIKVLSSDQLALDKTIGVIQGMAGAYQSVLGVTALLGVENEQLLEILVKMQAVQSIVNGLNQVSVMLSERSAAGIALRNIQTKILNTSLIAQTTVTSSATVATKALDTAMRSLPIIAVIAGLSALVYGISRYVSSSKQAAIETKELEEKQAELAKRQAENTKEVAESSTSYVSLIYQLKQTNSNSGERLNLINKINSTYGTTLQNLKDENDFQKQLNQSIDTYIKLQETKIIFRENEEEITELIVERLGIQKVLNDALKDENNIYEEGARTLFERNEGNLRAGRITREQYNETNKAIKQNIANEEESLRLEGLKRIGLDKQVVRFKEINEQLKLLTKSQLELAGEEGDNEIIPLPTDTDIDNAIKLYTDANKKFFDAIESDRISRIEDSREKELQAEATKYDNLIQLAEAAGMETTSITEKYQNLVVAINNKYDEEAKNNKIKLNNETLILNANLLMQEELNLAEYEEEKINIRNKYANRIRSLKIKELNDERDILLQNTSLTEEERNKIIADYALKNAKLMEDSITPAEDIEEKWFETFEGILSVTSRVLTEVANLTNAVFDQMAQNLENETNMRMKSYEDQELGYKTSLENQEISREEYEAKMKNLEITKQMEERSAKRKAFEQDKKTRITSAIMGIAQGVIAGLGAPFPMNIVMPALAAVTGGTQLGVIKNQQFKAATGGIVPGQPSKVDSVNARLAPGEAVINSTSTSMFGPILSRLNQIGGGKSLLPNTELKQEPTNSSFDRESDVRAYVTWSDIDQKNREDTRYRRNGRV